MRRRGLAMLVAAALVPFAANANRAHSVLIGMSDAERRAALGRFMQASGESCGRVTRTFYQGSDESGNAYWNVACSDGNSVVVAVHNDATGSTKIVNCALMKRLNTPCWVKW